MTLRREWALISASGLATFTAVGFAEPLSITGTLPVWAWCSLLLVHLLAENRRETDGTLLDSLGPATHVTMLRGALVALAAGFLRTPQVAAPAYTAAVFLDHVDGRIARRLGRETRLGAKLDLEVDAVGILVATLAGIVLGKLPYWYLLVGLARYLFVFGIEWRRRRGKPLRELDPSAMRRFLAGAQMAFLAVVLWPFVPAGPSHALSCLFGAASLAMFLRDWLHVSNRRA